MSTRIQNKVWAFEDEDICLVSENSEEVNYGRIFQCEWDFVLYRTGLKEECDI